MYKLMVAVCLAMLSSVVQADEPTYEEMFRNSFVSYCDGQFCIDTDTGERYELAGDPVKPGYVLNFSQPYTAEQVKKATPYILERYAQEEDYE
jgi:hypothetical protein